MNPFTSKCAICLNKDTPKCAPCTRDALDGYGMSKFVDSGLLASYPRTERPKDEVPTRGLRYNKGKRRYDLLPPDAMAMLADLLTKGAEKYAERNWELGMPYSDALGSLERHLQDWKASINNDDESGMNHMVHVMCNAMFLLTWQMRGVGQDDRVKVRMPDKAI